MGFQPQQSYFSLTLRVTVREMEAPHLNATLPRGITYWLSMTLVESIPTKTYWSVIIACSFAVHKTLDTAYI